MTGDWGGDRTRLENAGVDLRAHFITESAANPLGGMFQTARYTQQVDFGADLDLGRLAGDPGGTIQITFTHRAGRSLSADAIGNQFAVQQLYGAGQNSRLAELNYQQTLLAKRITFQLGWAPAGDSLASLPPFCDFQNGFICGHLNPMSTNSGAHNFPVGQWGARLKISPTPRVYLQAACYQVNPRAGDSDRGFDLSFHATGVLLPVEVGWQGTGKLAGIYKIGGYHNTSKTFDVLQDVNGRSAGLTDEQFATRSGRWGAYAAVDQIVWREAVDSKRLLRIGGIGGIGDRATAQYRYFFAAGGVRQGTFKHRNDDFIAVLFGYAQTNPRLTRFQEDRNTVHPGTVGVQTFESILEIDYNIQVAPWLTIRPNLQSVIRPNGTGRIPAAFVVGLHTGVTF